MGESLRGMAWSGAGEAMGEVWWSRRKHGRESGISDSGYWRLGEGRGVNRAGREEKDRREERDRSSFAEIRLSDLITLRSRDENQIRFGLTPINSTPCPA